VRGSGAEGAGLEATRRSSNGEIILGDVIVAVNGTRVKNSNDLLLLLEQKRAGDRVQVTVRRDQREVPLQVTLKTAS